MRYGEEAKEKERNPHQEVKSRQAAKVCWCQKGRKDSSLEAAPNEEIQKPQDQKARNLRAERAQMEQEEELERWEAEGGAISIKEAMAVGVREQEAVGTPMDARDKTLVQEVAA